MGNKVLNIVDFQQLYYKYYFMLAKGRLKRLEYNGVDTTLMYYTINDIESFSEHGKIPTVVCFDSKAKKKEEHAEYKSTRKSVLGSEDYECIGRIKDLLQAVGYEVYKEDGYEADDMIASVISKVRDDYDKIVIYTIDRDLCQLVDDKVEVSLYSTYGRTKDTVSIYTFPVIMSERMKVSMPYNFLKFFKCTVGDTSDNIKGVKGFGKAAFEKWLNSYYSQIDIKRCLDAEYVAQVLKATLNETQYAQAMEALDMVEFKRVDVKKPFETEFTGDREKYLEYGMKSFLIER